MLFSDVVSAISGESVMHSYNSDPERDTKPTDSEVQGSDRQALMICPSKGRGIRLYRKCRKRHGPKLKVSEVLY